MSPSTSIRGACLSLILVGFTGCGDDTIQMKPGVEGPGSLKTQNKSAREPGKPALAKPGGRVSD